MTHGVVSEVWPNPEGRPSAFWGINDPFEAIRFDFEVLANIRKAQREVTEKPKSARQAYRRSMQNYPEEMAKKVEKRILRQRAKAIKAQESDDTGE